MKNKKYFTIINIICLFLIVLVITLPLFKFTNPNTIFDNNSNTKTIFGFHLLSGFNCNSLVNDALGQGVIKVMNSKLLGFIPLAMILSMIVINKITSNDLGKYIINFLGNAVIFAFYLLLPAIIQTFLVDSFVDSSNFDIIWGYWILFVIFAILFAYSTFILFKTIIKVNKEKDELERNA